MFLDVKSRFKKVDTKIPSGFVFLKINLHKKKARKNYIWIGGEKDNKLDIVSCSLVFYKNISKM